MTAPCWWCERDARRSDRYVVWTHGRRKTTRRPLCRSCFRALRPDHLLLKPGNVLWIDVRIMLKSMGGRARGWTEAEAARLLQRMRAHGLELHRESA